jgi:hypothetical protein
MIFGTAGVAGIMTGLQSGQSGRKAVLAEHSSVIRVEVRNGCGPGSAVGIATGWTVRRSNPGGGEIFLTFPDRPWGPPSLLYNGYRVFPGGKERPGRDADPSPPYSAMVMKE